MTTITDVADNYYKIEINAILGQKSIKTGNIKAEQFDIKTRKRLGLAESRLQIRIQQLAEHVKTIFQQY